MAQGFFNTLLGLSHSDGLHPKNRQFATVHRQNRPKLRHALFLLRSSMPIEQISRVPTAVSCQLLVVIAEDWASTLGRLQRFVRSGVDRPWQLVGLPVAVSLGKSGLAWGRGLHPLPLAGRLKQEGDGRAPAGVFAITALFGEGGADCPLARAAKLPYLAATDDLKAIDDPASAYYNRIIDQSAIARPDWLWCEGMRRGDRRYEVGAVLAHNAEPVLPGAGSCIFLHVWEAAGVPTAGCTAMALADMSELAGWLDGAAAPLLVQLPQAEYERLRESWALPALTADA